MPRFRRGRRRGGMRRARSFVRRIVAKMGPIEPKRILLDNVAIPARTSVAYDNPVTIGLLTSTESVDEELESDGTNIAQVRPYSKVVGMKLNLQIFNNAATGGDRIRWMLVKDVDNEGALSSLVDANFHSADDTPTARELRARTLAKGFLTCSDRTAQRLSVFVRRKTLQRLGALRENDRFELLLAVSGSGAAAISGFGTIYVRMN